MILNLVLSGVLVFGGIQPAVIQVDDITFVQGNRQKEPDPPNRPDGRPTGPSNSGKPDDLPSRDDKPRKNVGNQQNQTRQQNQGSDRSQDVRQNEQRPRPQQQPRQQQPRQQQPRQQQQAQTLPSPQPQAGVQEDVPQRSRPIVTTPQETRTVEPEPTESPTEIEETEVTVDRSDDGIIVFDSPLIRIVEKIPGWVWWQLAFSLVVIYGLWLYARYHDRRYNEFVEEVRRLIHGDLDGPGEG